MGIQSDFRASKDDLRGVSALLGDALSQSGKLFQNEVDLAKAELGEKAREMGSALGFIGAGAVFVIPAITMALLSLSAALLAAGWPAAISYITSAVVAAVLAGVLFAIGVSHLKPAKLAPHETIRQLEKDKDVVKGAIR